MDRGATFTNESAGSFNNDFDESESNNDIPAI